MNYAITLLILAAGGAFYYWWRNVYSLRDLRDPKDIGDWQDDDET